MKRVLMLVAAMAVSSVVGCSTPSAPVQTSSSAVSKTSSGIIFHATASKATQKALGVVKWHSIVEHSSRSVVIDGVDANGKLKFSTSFHALKNGDFQFTDHMHKTELTFDKVGTIKSRSLSAQWQNSISLYSHDWQSFQQRVPYSGWAYVGAGLAVVGGVVAIATAPVWLSAAAVGGAIAIAGGVATALDNYSNDQASAAKDAANDQRFDAIEQKLNSQVQQQAPAATTTPDANATNPSSTTNPSDPSATNPTTVDPSTDQKQDPEATQPQQNDADPNDPNAGVPVADNSATGTDTSAAADNTQVADNDTFNPGESQGEDLPAASTDASSNLDTANLGTDDSASQVADNTDTTDNTQVADNTSSDDSAASSDDSGGSSDDSGDVDTASLRILTTSGTPAGTSTCKKVLKSKSTGISVCARY